MLKKMRVLNIFFTVFIAFNASAVNLVCIKSGEAIPPAESAKLNCNYHVLIKGALADPDAFEVDTKKRQSSTYDCFIKFDVGNSTTSPIRFIDPPKAGIYNSAKLIPRGSHYYSPDGQLINPAVYYEAPPEKNFAWLGTGATHTTIVDILKRWGLTTTQIGAVFDMPALAVQVYSKYSPEVLRNLGAPITGVYTSSGFIQGCKIAY